MHLLGDFSLLSGDTPVTTMHVARLQSLLAYLVLHRTAPQDRSHLAFLMWPDSTEARAHASLRKLLHQMRQAFPISTISCSPIDRAFTGSQRQMYPGPWMSEILNRQSPR